MLPVLWSVGRKCRMCCGAPQPGIHHVFVIEKENAAGDVGPKPENRQVLVKKENAAGAVGPYAR